MAFSIPWLETVSKRERQRREEKAQKLMFPFGDEQRTAELAVLRALIQTKARDADLLYQLFQAKDCLRPMQDEMPEDPPERLARGLVRHAASLSCCSSGISSFIARRQSFAWNIW